MAKDSRRPDRVAEAIREEVATFLHEGVKDPRVTGIVTVTGVDVTRDLRTARIFVSILGDDATRASTMEGLASVAGGLRGRVGRALRLRVAPEISFRLDESIARAARIETLLSQLRSGELPPTPDDDERPAAPGREIGGDADDEEEDARG
jgi:ribosome-binding factor A